MQQAALMRRAFAPGISASRPLRKNSGEVVRLLRKRGFTGPTLRFPTSRRPVPCAVTQTPFPALPVPSILLFSNRTVLSPDSIRTARGFARAIREEFSVDLRDLKVALLGSCGGAGLALAYTCAMQRCERLTLAGRSEEKLQELKNRLSSFFIDEHRLEGASDRLAAHQNNTPRFNAAVEEADLIVNATSPRPEAHGPFPVPLHCFPPTIWFMIYRRMTMPSRWKPAFRAPEFPNGLSMLVHQGALSFERWFGIKPDISAMRQALEQKHD